jgi:uncharacterized protein YacL
MFLIAFAFSFCYSKNRAMPLCRRFDMHLVLAVALGIVLGYLILGFLGTPVGQGMLRLVFNIVCFLVPLAFVLGSIGVAILCIAHARGAL